MHTYTFLVCFIWWLNLHILPTNCHSSNSLLLVISLDGFRWDYLDLMKSKGIPTPNFDKFIAEGGKADYMKATYPTKSVPNHWTIATGLYAESNGVVQNRFWDPSFKEAFDFFDVNQLKESKWWDNDGTVEPLWITNQRGDQTIFPRRSGVLFWPGGCAPYGKDNMYPEHYIQEGTVIDEIDRIKKVVSWFATEDKPINFAMLHLDGTDHLGHLYGPESQEVIDKIQEIDIQIGLLFTELTNHQLVQRLNIILLSDHGMAGITETIEIDKYLDPKLYKAYGFSPMWQIVPEEGHDTEVREALEQLAANNSKVTVYLDKNTPKEFHFSKHRRVLSIIVTVPEGVQLAHNASEQKVADHGYPDSAAMHAFLAVHGPAFEAGTKCGPVSEVDIYPLMCHVLDIDPGHPHNGSLDLLQQLLSSHEHADHIAYVTFITFVTSVGFAATVSGIFCVAACRVYRISRYRRRLHIRRADIPLNSVNTDAQKSLLTSDDDEEEEI